MWIQGIRPKTLPASIAPVLVGIALAWNHMAWSRRYCGQGHDNMGSAMCDSPYAAVGITPSWFWAASAGCLIVALSLQIAVNFANDYSDGIRGTDAGRSTGDVRQPDTHGDWGAAQAPTRLVASGVPPRHVLAAAGIAAAVACVVGLALIIAGGRWWLLAVGVISLVAGWFYTGGKHPYGYAGWGEVAVFLFFGPVAVAGTQYAIVGGLGLSSQLTPAATVAGLNAAALLLINNIRDIETDRESGKRTYAARVGRIRATTTLQVILVLSVVISMLSLARLPLRFGGANMPGIVLGIMSALPLIGAVYVGLSTHRGEYRRALSSAGLLCLLSAVCWSVALLGHASYTAYVFGNA